MIMTMSSRLGKHKRNLPLGHTAVRGLWQSVQLEREVYPQAVVVPYLLPQPHRRPLLQIGALADKNAGKDLMTLCGPHSKTCKLQEWKIRRHEAGRWALHWRREIWEIYPERAVRRGGGGTRFVYLSNVPHLLKQTLKTLWFSQSEAEIVMNLFIQTPNFLNAPSEIFWKEEEVRELKKERYSTKLCRDLLRFPCSEHVKIPKIELLVIVVKYCAWQWVVGTWGMGTYLCCVHDAPTLFTY